MGRKERVQCGFVAVIRLTGSQGPKTLKAGFVSSAPDRSKSKYCDDLFFFFFLLSFYFSSMKSCYNLTVTDGILIPWSICLYLV